jgi:peptidoglycan-N-acetylglucosamine deacetylase
MKKYGKGALLIVGGLTALMAGLYFLSKSRTFQILGEVVASVPTKHKAVALTFDDGPTPGFTDEVLEYLRRENVKATFFLVGADIQESPGEARKIAAAGHEIGNHTFSHSRMLFRSLDFIAKEIESTDALIRSTGYAGPIHFRAPYGKRLFGLPYYLWKTGRKHIYYDVEPESYPEVAADSGRLADYVVGRVKPGSIVLLHVMFDSRRESMLALPAILGRLKDQGYSFKTVSELLALRAG